MKKLGVVNSVLAGKTVTFAHGANSAIDKQVLSERQHATELGFTNDEQGDPRFHGGIQKLFISTRASTTQFGSKSWVTKTSSNLQVHLAKHKFKRDHGTIYLFER